VPPVLVKDEDAIYTVPPALKKYRAASTLAKVIVKVVEPVTAVPGPADIPKDLLSGVVTPKEYAVKRLVAAVEIAELSVGKNVILAPTVGALIPDPLPLW
jgi:hypothetical protein